MSKNDAFLERLETVLAAAGIDNLDTAEPAVLREASAMLFTAAVGVLAAMDPCVGDLHARRIAATIADEVSTLRIVAGMSDA